MFCSCLLFWFYGNRESSRTFFDRFLGELMGNDAQESSDALLEEFSVEVFFAPAKCEIYFDLVAGFEELRALFRLKLQVVEPRADADANAFYFHLFPFLGRLARLFFLFVKIFSAIHYLGNRRIGGGGYFYEVQPDLVRRLERFLKREQTEVCPIMADDSQFRGAYLVVDSGFLDGGTGLFCNRTMLTGVLQISKEFDKLL